ncbi:DegT/DnrJ/EryC1/StrS family aminotransferase [Micromonospora tulbaghiae]|uniref:DegT/DnrJ/EryC1/StrS aminotransferase family protein n=1 Tax=Micromonospora tulbaghiae TaxID=479978 RepID=UPI0033E1E8C6
MDALSEVFASGWLGRGPRTAAFEAAFAAHIGVEPAHMTFLSSGTAGLFLAIELLGLGPGDDVVLPSVSFVAAANAITASGARTVFCDVDPRTLNPSCDDVERAVTGRTRAVVILHYGGYPGDIAAVADFCRQRGLMLIEDAACAVASTVSGRACGTFGDIAMWSFDAMKVLVTGDGGMLWVRDPELAARAGRLSYHGLAQDSGLRSAARVPHRWWELKVRDFGRRVVGNDVTAAIGAVQLSRLPDLLRRRAEIVRLYDELLADTPGVRLPPPLPDGHTSSYYFYWVQLDATVRDAVAADLLQRGIYTTFRYPPLHKVPVYGARVVLPETEQAAEETLLLPLHAGLDDDEVRTVAGELRAAVRRHGAGYEEEQR